MLKPKNQKVSDSEIANNVYALTEKNEAIHISQAKSGRKGYYCLGCQNAMQAVIPKVENITPYFRHDPNAVKHPGKCTYSDETYRHKLAKGMLQDLKRIKVPALYKYPPKGVEGKANFISGERFIHATHVRLELSFFEDENGEVRYGKNTGVKEKSLLIRPDVTFFDKDDQPILFIEVVATHKITDEKRIKIKHLGVDTIQVSIPRGTPDEIEKTLLTSSRTKWIYNYEQEQREYIPIPEGIAEEIPSIDEQQRKLFEESFTCRQSEIGNLIRQFTRCLESKPYRDSELRVRRELQKVEKATKRIESELEELRERAKESAEKELANQEIEFQNYRSDLERRYQSKKGELEDTKCGLRGEETNLESGYYSKREILIAERESIDKEQSDIERRRAEISNDIESDFRESREEFEQYFERAEAENQIIRRDIKKLQESSRKTRKDIRGKIFELYEKDDGSYRTEKEKIDKKQEDTQIQIRLVRKKIKDSRESQRKARAEIREKYFRIRKDVEQGKFKATNFEFKYYFRELKKTIALRESFITLEEGLYARKRYRSAIEAIESKAYLDWME